MKKLLFLYLLALCALGARAQTDKEDRESSSPSYNTEIVRRCNLIDIEGAKYTNVVVTLKSGKNFWTSTSYDPKYYVKVVVKDIIEGKRIYKKTFKNCYLYLFSNGQIQVARQKFNKVVIKPEKMLDEKLWYGKIREKEGIWDD